jgi:hypothetical protein
MSQQFAKEYVIVLIKLAKKMQTVKPKVKTLLSAIILMMSLALPASVLAANPCNDTTNATGQVSPAQVSRCVQSTPIWHDVNLIVNFLSAGVGIVVTGVILVGGIQYIAAGDNPNALTAARQRITNGLIALFVFLFIYGFLQWLIPGGIFKT